MASTYLTHTTSTPTNNDKCTISFWIKFSSVGSDLGIFSQHTDSNNRIQLARLSSGALSLFQKVSSSIEISITTNRLFRDVSAWYHVVIAFDTTQSTASDRVKFYVNGVQETSFSVSTYPSQNTDIRFNSSSLSQEIGRITADTYMDGAMSHVHFIDGIAYTPSAFGETDTTTGEWKAKTSPSVTYGNNGFFILKDGNGITDQSGEGNDFTLGGGTLTNLKDNPDNVFATLNPLARRLTSNDPTYLNGNTTLQGQTVNGQNNNGLATLGDLAKGKYYFECKIQTIGDNCGVGIVDTPDPSNGIPEGSHEIFYSNDGNKWNGSGYVSYGATYTTGDIIGCAFDVTSGTVEFYKNGVSQGTAATDLATNLNYGYTPMGYTNKGVMNFNFGNGYFGTTAVTSAQNPTDGIGIFEYTPPTNYRAVCTKSINAQEYS